MAFFPGEAGRSPNPADRKSAAQTFETQRTRDLREEFTREVELWLQKPVPEDKYFCPATFLDHDVEDLLAEAGLEKPPSIVIIADELDKHIPLALWVEDRDTALERLYVAVSDVAPEAESDPSFKLIKRPYGSFVKVDIDDNVRSIPMELPVGPVYLDSKKEMLVEDNILVFHVDEEGLTTVLSVRVTQAGIERIFDDDGRLLTDEELGKLGAERKEETEEELDKKFVSGMSLMRSLVGLGDWRDGEYITRQTPAPRAETLDQDQKASLRPDKKEPTKIPLLINPGDYGKFLKTAEPGKVLAIMWGETAGFPDYKGELKMPEGTKTALFSSSTSSESSKRQTPATVRVETERNSFTGAVEVRKITINILGVDLEKLKDICEKQKFDFSMVTYCLTSNPALGVLQLELVAVEVNDKKRYQRADVTSELKKITLLGEIGNSICPETTGHIFWNINGGLNSLSTPENFAAIFNQLVPAPPVPEEKPKKQTVKPGRIIGMTPGDNDRQSNRPDGSPKPGTLAALIEKAAEGGDKVQEVVLWTGAGRKYEGSDPKKKAEWEAKKQQRRAIEEKKNRKHHFSGKTEIRGTHGVVEGKQKKEKGWHQR